MKFGKVKLLLSFLVLIFISGCITDKSFWHPDNRKRIPFRQTIQISEEERDIITYMLMERLLQQRKMQNDNKR